MSAPQRRIIFTRTPSRTGLLDYGPLDVRKQMKEVNDFLAAVNKDMQVDTKKTGNNGFYSTWTVEVYAPWLAFYKEFQKPIGGASVMRDSTFRRAEAFRQLGLRYRENLIAKSGAGTVVTPVKIPNPIKLPSLPNQKDLVDTASSRDSDGLPWRKILIAVGIGGAVYFGYRYYTAPARKLERLAQARKEKQEAETEELASNPQPHVIVVGAN